MDPWIIYFKRRKHCSDDGGLKVKVIRWRVGQFLLDVLLSDPIKVPTSSPQNQTIRHIFSSSVYISFNPPHNWSFCVFWFCSTGSKCFFFLSCSVYHFTFGEIYVFAQDKLTSYTVHNFPKKWLKMKLKLQNCYFYANKHCKSEFSKDVEKLSRESTNWNCFLTSFHFLLWKLATISIPSASFKIPTSTIFSISQKCVMYSPNLNIFHKRPFHDVCPHLDHHWWMRKVELSHKTSVKSLQGNKKHNIILLPALFLFQTALNRTANLH